VKQVDNRDMARMRNSNDTVHAGTSPWVEPKGFFHFHHFVMWTSVLFKLCLHWAAILEKDISIMETGGCSIEPNHPVEFEKHHRMKDLEWGGHGRKRGILTTMNKKISWYILVIICLGVGIFMVFPYVTLDPSESRIQFNPSFSLHYPLLVTHIFLAFIALITGFVQFTERVRIQYPKMHRNLGRIYFASVFLSGIIALVLTIYVDRFVKALVFLTLSLLWLFTGWKGYRSILKKRYEEHQIWMIRNYAVTLTAITARLIVPVCILAYLSFNGFKLVGGREQMVSTILEVNIWIGLVLNLIFVEWMILKKQTDKSHE